MPCINLVLIDGVRVSCMSQIKAEGGAVADSRASTIQALFEADHHGSVYQCSGLGAPTALKDRPDRNPPRHRYAQVRRWLGT